MNEKVASPAASASVQFEKIADFVLTNKPSIPESALNMAARLLLDSIGVAAGATHLDAGRIARNYAVEFMAAGNSGQGARLMFDGRRASVVGAAFAAATQIDNLDGHDGYNPTKGHIGCAVVPALLAFAELDRSLSGRKALEALAISYEVAARAGISLHATVSDYHTSGAWNSLGVAALGCRLTDSDTNTLRQALGIAEYHGPRSQMMREIANPSMLHDGSGMGALSGASAVFLAQDGFTGAPAITVEHEEAVQHWDDLGTFWTIEHNYIKPYPICRWSHAAIDAVRSLMLQEGFTASDVSSVSVSTFHEAAQLYADMPNTTSQAQYSLAFAIAVFLHHGRIGPEHISGAMLADVSVSRTIKRITIVEDEKHSSRFPQSRWSDVSIVLKDGRSLQSGNVHARGGPEAPMEELELREKFNAMTAQVLSPEKADAIWSKGFDLLNEGSKFIDFCELIYEGHKGAAQ